MIENDDDLRTAMHQYWICTAQLKEAQLVLKAHRKAIMDPLKEMVDSAKILGPEIADYMLKCDRQAIRFEGKKFYLTKRKCKLTGPAMEEYLSSHGIAMETIENAKGTKPGIKCDAGSDVEM